jgi:hypothetical protein
MEQDGYIVTVNSNSVEVAPGDYRTIVSASLRTRFVVEEVSATSNRIKAEVETTDVLGGHL